MFSRICVAMLKTFEFCLIWENVPTLDGRINLPWNCCSCDHESPVTQRGRSMDGARHLDKKNCSHCSKLFSLGFIVHSGQFVDIFDKYDCWLRFICELEQILDGAMQ